MPSHDYDTFALCLFQSSNSPVFISIGAVKRKCRRTNSAFCQSLSTGGTYSDCSNGGPACQTTCDAASDGAARQRLHADVPNGLAAGLLRAPPDNVHLTSAVLFVSQKSQQLGLRRHSDCLSCMPGYNYV